MPALKRRKAELDLGGDIMQQQARSTSQVADILGSHTGDENVMKKARKSKDDEHRGSLHMLRALDHQLRLAGVGLSAFARLDSYSKFLGKSEIRY